MNISASHVLLQSKSSPASRTSSAWRTASKFAPQTVQNFTSSVWFELHRGQIIDYHSFLVLKDTRSYMEMFFCIVLGAQASSPARYQLNLRVWEQCRRGRLRSQDDGSTD